MPQALWDQCLRKLELDFNDREVNTWLRPLEPRLLDNRLMLAAPNAVVLKRVRDDYMQAIHRAMQQLHGDQAPLVEIELRSSQADQPFVEPVGEALSPEAQLALGRLNPQHSFENFIEGKSNAQARAAAQQVADDPGAQFNPLLIYGGVGLGKTHLMSAIGNRIRQRKVGARVLYVGAEKFVRDLVSAIRLNRTEAFKERYRQVDALLIDDIQFFIGKGQTQEEFFHTFNELLDARQQMVLTSDRYPKDLDGLDERLKSRFIWGLVVSVEPPELETRVAILQSKAEQLKVRLPEEVAFFIGQRVRHNVRELEGALNRLSASSQMMGVPISVDFARETLRDMISAYDRLITIDNIKREVAQYYNIRGADLSSKRRTRSLARPRQIAMSLCKELTQHSYPEIGEAFEKDHTTVLHAVRKVKELCSNDHKIREDYDILQRKLGF